MKSALVILTEGSEDLECVTVMDVLRRGGIKVTAASVSQDITIHCANGTKVLADAALSAVKDHEFDALVLPGGGLAAETYSSVPDSQVQSLIKAFEAAGKTVAVICASTMAIHAAGAFKGKKATSYPSLRSKVDDLYDYQEQNVVVDGQLITSRGPATAMAFALAIVEHLVGKATSSKVGSDLLFH